MERPFAQLARPLRLVGTYARVDADYGPWVEFDGSRFPAGFAPGEVTIYYGAGRPFPSVYRR